VRPALQIPLAILVGVLVRVPFWIEALRTPVDGDTAIVGLMARHLGQGTTLWGQPYGSPLDAWLAAPFVSALGPTPDALRLSYFLLGLALIPIAHALARALHPAAAFPAAILMACPPPYFLLLSALPPPFYASTLLLCGVLLVLALRLGERLQQGQKPRGGLVLWGALAGLALWTHLMSASAVLAGGVYLFRRARGHSQLLLAALLPLLAASSPWWVRALADRQATRVVRVSGREETMGAHLLQVLPELHRPLGGVLGTHVPVVADTPDFVVSAPRAAAAGLILIYGSLLVLAVRRARGGAPGLLLGAAALALLAFPFPVRATPHNIRFLTPLFLPVLALSVFIPASSARPRRAWLVVLSLAGLHLTGSTRLLEVWRGADRAQPPFLLPDLAPARRALEARGIRRAYASYGPAYRLTYESGEKIIASQPWNERFRHYPLPFLDEVSFAQDVAWVLTPAIPTDLPAPKAFEEALSAIGGRWRRSEAGAAVIFHDFVPPFGPSVEAFPEAGPAGDLDLRTVLTPDNVAPTVFRLPAPRPLDAITLVAGLEGPRLLRSMDVEVSADGVAFDTVVRRRRREEQDDLRWVNGHPQYVLDHDLLAIPLGGRPVAALRITPYVSSDPWALAEVLLHPAEAPVGRRAWDEWLDPNLGWPARARALAAHPRPDREDWYYRMLLAARH
jgi:hypothetical protein